MSNFQVTVDAVVISRQDKTSEILLIKRLNDPFKGQWALPGGFVEPGETLEHAACRELNEETGAKISSMKQVGAFGDPGRDPRGPTVSIAYFSEIDFENLPLKAGSDAGEFRWFPIKSLPELAFDHACIIATSIERFDLG